MVSAASRPLSVLVPQRGDDVGNHEIRRVLSDQLQDEDAVLTQVGLREGGRRLAVAVIQSIISVTDLEMPAHVDQSTVAEADGPQPARDADDRHGGHANQPKPKERVDLLVKEVDRQDALDRVSVHGAHLSDAEVTQSDAWKPTDEDVAIGCRPTTAPHTASSRQIYQHLDAVRAVVGGQKRVEQEDLRHGVSKIEQLGDDVQQ